MWQNIKLDGTEFITLLDPPPLEQDETNVMWKRTADGGIERSVKIGEVTRRRGYRILLELTDDTSSGSDDESLFDAFIDSLDNYSDTFTLVDHNGESYSARFIAPPIKQIIGPSHKMVDMEMIEVLS